MHLSTVLSSINELGMIILENTANLNTMTSEELQDATPKARFGAVDIAKGILILAVVLSHAWFANADILGNFFPYAMPAFFFLSGYTYKPGRGYFRNIGKRAVHLLLPYLFFGIACYLLYPLQVTLTKVFTLPSALEAAKKGIIIATLKADAINMMMGTPMWFLAALFTGSIIFFALADRTRDSLPKTIIASAVLLAAALVIELVKKENLVWFIDYAPFGAAMMLLGTYFGNKKLFSKLSIKAIIVGLVCIAAATVINRFFPGSGKTSIVQYVEGDHWYGVITAFAIAITGSIGILCVSRVVDLVPVLRGFFKWLGKNSLWILCIHYAVIMLAELQLFNMHVLSNSITQVVAAEIFGFGKVTDTGKDIVVKILVALFSIGVSAVYTVIHNAVRKLIKNNLKKKAA